MKHPNLLVIRHDPAVVCFDHEFDFAKVGACFTGGGSGGGGSSPPANTTSQNTTTYIQDVPQWEEQYLSNLLGQAQTVAGQPYQQFPGQQVAGFTDPQTQAFSNIENLANNGSWGQTENAATNSAMAGANTAGGISAAGSPYYQASTAYNPLAAAAPFMGAAANTATPQGIQSYLSPYTGDVVNNLVNTANQNWNNNIMPGVNDAFIGSGQFGSGRNAQVLGQQANIFQQNLEGQVSNALQSGYGMAGQMAGQQAGILGNLGNTAASAAGAQAANLQGAGSGLGNLQATQAGAQAGAASNLAGVGQTGLNTGIAANAALQDVGQQQQQQNQANINTAMQNFQTQTMWPQQQTSFLSNIIRGLPAMGTSGTAATQTPTTVNQVGSVSPLSTLAGSLVGLGGIGGVSGAAGAGGAGSKKGGLIRGYADGGLVDPPTPDEIDAEMKSPLQAATSTPSPIAMPMMGQGSGAVSPLQNIPSPVNDNQERGLQLLAIARGFLTPAHSGAEALGNAFGGLESSIYKEPALEQGREAVTSGNMANQMSALGLQRMQTMQPAMLARMAGLNGGSGGGGGSDSSGMNPYAMQGLQWAEMSGDPAAISKANLSIYEHDPKLAGQTELEKQGKTLFKLPNGGYTTGDSLMHGSAGSAPSPMAAASAPVAAGNEVMAFDGKPFVPGLEEGMAEPDPSSRPTLNSTPSANTDTAVTTTNEANKAQITKIYKGDETLTSSLSSLSKEQFRIDELMKLYQQTQSGTAIAHVPELANQLAAMGVISDPKTIHSLADLQAASANHVMQIIQQIKDTNSNLGAQPTRTFSSEVSGMIDNGENAKLQPEALYKLLTQAKALTNYQMDMTRGWTRVGGTGNRIGHNGYTMPPDTYAQKFMDTHDVGDYLKKTEEGTPAFKGMTSAQAPSPQDIVNELRKRGHKIQ